MFMEDTAIFYVSEIILAIEHLHSLGIIYRYLSMNEKFCACNCVYVCLSLIDCRLYSFFGKKTTCASLCKWLEIERLEHHVL